MNESWKYASISCRFDSTSPLSRIGVFVTKAADFPDSLITCVVVLELMSFLLANRLVLANRLAKKDVKFSVFPVSE